MAQDVISCVKSINGRQFIFVDGKRIDSESYISYYPSSENYKQFVDLGYKLFFVPLYFHEVIMNEYTNMKWDHKGIFDNGTHFELIDEEFDKLLSLSEDVYIIPRVHIALSREWEEAHPDELNDKALTLDHKRASYSSDAALEEQKREIKLFIDYINQSKYKNKVIGYQLSDGNTQEWMSFDYNGSQSKRSREKFAEAVKNDEYKDTELDYHLFLVTVNSKRICELSQYVKDLCNNRIIMGTFYGYSLCLDNWVYLHHDLQRVLKSPAIDFVCSPLAYWTSRAIDEDHPAMCPADTLNLHGKMYFQENDTRTDLTTWRFENPSYRTPLWLGPERKYSLEICKMHHALSLCHQSNYWWFDMWGGWYADKDYVDLFAIQSNITKQSYSKDTSSVFESCFIYDEKSYCYTPFEHVYCLIGRDIQKNISKAGVPYDSYMVDDFDQIKDKYKFFIVAVPYLTERLKKAISYLEENNIPHLVVDINKYDYTPEEIREMYIKNGLKPKFNFNSIVYENKSYLFVHTVQDCVIDFDNREDYKELYGHTLPIQAEKGMSYLFLKKE